MWEREYKGAALDLKSELIQILREEKTIIIIF